MDFHHLVRPYSPWFHESGHDEWGRQRAKLPVFHRPVFDSIREHLDGTGQILSVIGPRRVGKSTLLRQLVVRLIADGVPPSRIIYYSLDDAALYLRGASGGDVIEAIMEHVLKVAQDGRPFYLLLDEVQTLDAWELYLKKYYDLKYPVRIVVSGSASSPIFKKSRESLLGRVNDFHVLPFSFREYLLHHTQADMQLQSYASRLQQCGAEVRGMFTRTPEHHELANVNIPTPEPELWTTIQKHLDNYMVDGGFPEVWEMDTQEEKIDYLFSNQVTKVITEDLVLAVEFRKPEQLKKFYISLLERPGREVNMSLLSSELGINVQQIDKYLPLLEMTDLIRHAEKFRPSPVRVHQGSRKFYPVDLALRNAVLRLGHEIHEDPTIIGTYAETLAFNALMKWPGVLGVDYYRDGKKEVDFVVHTRQSMYSPIEVKYRNQVSNKDARTLLQFSVKYNCHTPILVTKNIDGFGRHTLNDDTTYFQMPLGIFLLLFD